MKKLTDKRRGELAVSLVRLKSEASSLGMWGVFKHLNNACESRDWLDTRKPQDPKGGKPCGYR